MSSACQLDSGTNKALAGVYRQSECPRKFSPASCQPFFEAHGLGRYHERVTIKIETWPHVLVPRSFLKISHRSGEGYSCYGSRLPLNFCLRVRSSTRGASNNLRWLILKVKRKEEEEGACSLSADVLTAKKMRRSKA